MAITTYAELQTAVGTWMNRSDLTSQIPDFITMAESEFDRTLKHHKLRTRSTATVSTQYLDLPDDWKAPITVRLMTANRISPLDLLSQDGMLEMRATVGESVGKPRYVSTQGDTLDFLPTPDQSYTVEMHYWARLAKLSASNTTNWLLTSYPDVYLYGSLCAAEQYVMNDERMPLWQARLEKAYNEMRSEYDQSYGPARAVQSVVF